MKRRATSRFSENYAKFDNLEKPSSIVAASPPFAERRRFVRMDNHLSQEWIYGYDFTA